MLQTIFKKFYKTLPISLLFCATIFIFAPFETYLNNSIEFNYSFATLCYTIIPKAILSWLCVSIFLTIMPEKFNINKRILAILFMVSILFIIQGMFLTKGYGVLDGATKIETFSARAVINIIIWSVGLFIGIFFYNFLYSHLNKLCAILIITQIIPLSLGIYNNTELETSDADLWYRNYKIDGNKNLFSYSKDENIIFIVADSFSYETLEKILSEKEYQDMFSGFNSFSDVASNFPTTAVSITSMLTGQIYDNSIPRNDFIKNSFLSQESLPMLLKNQGYWLKANKVSGVAYTTPELFDNVIEMDKKKINATISSLVNATLFKYMPHHFKQSFININATKNLSTKFQWADAGIFKKINESKFDNDSQAPTFTYIHLNGSHLPFIVDENFNISNTATEISQSKATLKLIASHMNRLKDIGVYDNSTIIIVSDHTLVKNKKLFPNHAILMIKRKGEKEANPLKEIDTPISLSDVSELTRWLLNNKNIEEFTGKMPRRYYDYKWEDSWEFRYMPLLTEYLINNHVSKQDLYIKTSKTFSNKEIISFPFGEEIILVNDYKDIKELLVGSWKEESSGIIFFQRSGIIIGDQKPQIFRIYITSLEEGKEKTNIYVIKTSDDNLYKTFFIPKDKIIKSILVSISDENHVPILYGEIFTGESKFSYAYLFGDGWHGPEDNHIWSSDKKSSIPLLLEHMPKTDINIQVNAAAFLGKTLKQQTMDILVNNSIVKSVKFNSEKNNQNINFTVPKSLIKDNTITITFILDKELTSPNFENGAPDFRTLGVSLSAIIISESPHILLKNNVKLSANDFGHIVERMDGWYGSENNHIWSANTKSVLRLSLENPPTNDMTITFGIIPFLTEKFNSQTLDVIIDDKIIKTIDYKYGDNQNSFTVNIPKSLFLNSIAKITFSLHKELTTPKEEGINADDRLLGIDLSSITLHETN